MIICFIAIVVVYCFVFVKVLKLGIRRATLKKGSYTPNEVEEVVDVDVDDGDGANTRAPIANGDVVRMETFRMSTSVQLLKKDAALMRRTLVIAALITFFFIFSWLPVLMIQHWQILPNIPVFRKIVHLNTVANPVIYALTNRDFRDSVRRRFSD